MSEEVLDKEAPAETATQAAEVQAAAETEGSVAPAEVAGPPENILEEAPPAEAADASEEEADASEEAPPAAEVWNYEEFGERNKGEIGADYFGEVREFSAIDASTIAPVLEKIGLSPSQGSQVVAALRAYEQCKLAAETELFSKKSAELAEASRAAFGEDLPRIVADANRGGESIFGAEVWGDLRRDPIFANDSRVISALAAIGKGKTVDTGTQGKDSGGAHDRDFLDWWTRGKGLTQG